MGMRQTGKTSLLYLLYVSKIIFIITIIFGIIGILNTPNHTFSYFVEESIFFIVSKWILSISFLSQMIIVLIAKNKYKNNLSNENKNILEKLSLKYPPPCGNWFVTPVPNVYRNQQAL